MKAENSSRLLQAVAVGLVVFALALFLRTANYRVAFVGHSPQIAPFDELYHAKRILYSALHPGRVLDLDPDRGVGGAFTPWAPLYDLLAGGAARLLGGRSAVEVLTLASWFPPIVTSLFLALLAGVLTLRVGSLAGFLAGVGASAAATFLDKSKLGGIDHHFLEPPLVLGILAAICGFQGMSTSREVVRRGATFGLALIAALLVQPALLLAAGIAFLVVLFLEAGDRTGRRAAAFGFLVAAMLVLLYRWTRPKGYPDTEWFLGLTQAAALLAASAGCAADAWLLERGVARASAALVAATCAALTAAAVPTAIWGLLGGSEVFGGDPWLRTVAECRPLFFQPGSLFWGDLCLLGGGALLVIPLLLDRRWRSGSRAVLATFAVVYMVAAISANRFLVIASPLLALSGAVYVSDLRRAGRPRLIAAFAGLVLLAPSFLLAIGPVAGPTSPIPSWAVPVIRAAQTLRLSNFGQGRVLPPWSWGHVFDVLGGRAVLIDNFGPMPDRVHFENAVSILLSPREDAVAAYCRATGTRFIVIENPAFYFGVSPGSVGLPQGPYGETTPTRLMKATFWWRAYFAEPGSTSFRNFRRIYNDIEPVSTRPENRTGVQIWELVGSVSSYGNEAPRGDEVGQQGSSAVLSPRALRTLAPVCATIGRRYIATRP